MPFVINCIVCGRAGHSISLELCRECLELLRKLMLEHKVKTNE